MSTRVTSLIATALVAAAAFAAAGPPLAGVWNIAATGTAGSSGALAFRITPADGSNPLDITVPVIAGASQDTLVRSIRRALSSQLRPDKYNVQLGEGANVLVSDPRGKPNFSIELIDSDIENVRVAVQSVTPSASPTVPEQAVPAEGASDAPPATNAPGNVIPPPSSIPPPSNSTPVPSPEIPVPSPTIPPPSPNMPVPPQTPAPAPGNSSPPATQPVPGQASPPKMSRGRRAALHAV